MIVAVCPLEIELHRRNEQCVFLWRRNRRDGSTRKQGCGLGEPSRRQRCWGTTGPNGAAATARGIAVKKLFPSARLKTVALAKSAPMARSPVTSTPWNRVC